MPESQTLPKKVPEPLTPIASLRRLLACDERGATAIEYAMVAAGVGMAVATAVWGVGSALKTNFYGALAALF
jgi:pilus assembly protein Flp/PilA